MLINYTVNTGPWKGAQNQHDCGSVVVDKDKLYFVAGRASYLDGGMTL